MYWGAYCDRGIRIFAFINKKYYLLKKDYLILLVNSNKLRYKIKKSKINYSNES